MSKSDINDESRDDSGYLLFVLTDRRTRILEFSGAQSEITFDQVLDELWNREARILILNLIPAVRGDAFAAPKWPQAELLLISKRGGKIPCTLEYPPDIDITAASRDEEIKGQRPPLLFSGRFEMNKRRH